MPSKQRLVIWWQSCVEEGKKIWRVLLWSRRYLYRQRHNAQTGCAVSRLQTLSSHTQSLSTCRRNTSSDKLPVLLLLNKPYTTSKWSRQWKSSWHLLTEIIQEFYIDLECCQLMFSWFSPVLSLSMRRQIRVKFYTCIFHPSLSLWRSWM